MSNKTEITGDIYKGKYDSNFLWKNMVEKLTVRQAYVFYYSLAFYEKNEIAVGLGVFDLPDKTMVHKCLIDALLKEKNPKEVAETIGANAHKILINDNDILWIKAELRAALWLSYFVTKSESGGDKLLLDLLRSTSRLELTNRLIHVLDIYGCSLRGDTAENIRVKFDKGVKDLCIDYLSFFNKSRGNYVSNRIDDSKLNWLNKLPEDEIDVIIERFIEDKILILYGVFVPIVKKDKIELIKASLDIQNYRYIQHKNNESLQPFSTYSASFATNSSKAINKNIKYNDKKRKDFTYLNADEIITLLKKAYISREYRKVTSNTKKNNSIALNKESHTILIALFEKLGATPKKIVEALIKRVALEDKNELSEIDKHIAGRRSIKTQSSQKELVELKEPIEPEELIELEPIAELEKYDESTDSIVQEERIEPKECTEAIASRMKDSSKVNPADEIELENDLVQVGELDKLDMHVEPKETIHAFIPELEESDKTDELEELNDLKKSEDPEDITESEKAFESVREVKPTTKAKTNSDIKIETEVSKKEKPETRNQKPETRNQKPGKL